jgi:hypothetical protein
VKAVRKLCKKMRRLWIAERCLGGLLLVAGWAANAALLWLLLCRMAAAPPAGVLAAGILGLLGLAAVVVRAHLQAPRGGRLAQLVDQRARSRDLYASAWEFQNDPARFGPLGELTCRKAGLDAGQVVLVPRWSLGRLRDWVAMLAAALLLGGTYAAAIGLDRLRNRAAASAIAAVEGPNRSAGGNKRPAGPRLPDEPPPNEKSPPAGLLAPEEAQAEKPADETVKITNEMIDRYLQQVPEQEKVSLDGVTPIRWDEDEASGKANPQNRKDSEKINPVKLDAAFLKDLEAAKKTKIEGGPGDAAVDVAVMGKQDQGSAAKGKSGGQEGKESLADAASKDPRGNPTRLAVKPARQGLQITSVARAASREKGQIRPMGLVEYLAAMKKAQAAAVGLPAEAVPPAAGPAPDRIVPDESGSEAAAELIESYFSRLRRADQ